jgi:hypothetical protein
MRGRQEDTGFFVTPAPDGAVGVLAAVLAHARRAALDVVGVRSRSKGGTSNWMSACPLRCGLAAQGYGVDAAGWRSSSCMNCAAGSRNPNHPEKLPGGYRIPG